MKTLTGLLNTDNRQNFSLIEALVIKYDLQKIDVEKLRDRFLGKSYISENGDFFPAKKRNGLDTRTGYMSIPEIFDNFKIVASTISKSGKFQYQRLAGIFLMKVVDILTPKRLFEMKRNPIFVRHYRIWVEENENFVKNILDFEKNYTYDYIAIKTFLDTYLAQNSIGIPTECPQMLFLRVAYIIGCTFDETDVQKQKPVRVDLSTVKQVYFDLANKFYTHATPTLMNAALKTKQQYASCFLIDAGSSFLDFCETIPKLCEISCNKGGIGLFVGKIPANDTIFGSCMKILDCLSEGCKETMIDCGRPSAISVWLPVWHGLVEFFVESRNPFKENVKEYKEDFFTTKFFTGLFLNDLFMKRLVKSVVNEKNCSDERLISISKNTDETKWSLFCPKKCPQLLTLHGEEFEKEYLRLEKGKLYCKQVETLALANKILAAQQRSGTPFTSFSDTVNHMSSQKNIGPILTSNLCTEIYQYCKFGEEIGVCNLASLNLKAFLKTPSLKQIQQMQQMQQVGDIDGNHDMNNEFAICQFFDFDLFQQKASQLVYNLNKIIDNNVYSHKESFTSNKKNRPIGIGVQGFQNILHQLQVGFESNEAMILNFNIFERLFYACIKKGAELAKGPFKPYDMFKGSPLSEGVFHFELCKDKNFFDQAVCKYYWPGTVKSRSLDPILTNDEHDEHDELFRRKWDDLRVLARTGVTNSLFTALMPTATTSMIFSNHESIEPMYAPCFKKAVSKDEMYVWSHEFLTFMAEQGLADREDLFEKIDKDESVANLDEISEKNRSVFKTAYEINQTVISDMAALRGPFLDQGQSLNFFYSKNNLETNANLTENMIYSVAILKNLINTWINGCKNGNYYIRTSNDMKGENVHCLRKKVSNNENGCKGCGS